jgi:hypothetical protein
LHEKGACNLINNITFPLFFFLQHLEMKVRRTTKKNGGLAPNGHKKGALHTGLSLQQTISNNENLIFTLAPIWLPHCPA